MSAPAHAPRSYLVSGGTALPGPPVTNADLARRFGMDTLWEQWVDGFIGTRTRHLAVDLDSREIGWSLADLVETAGRRALDDSGLDPSDIDLIVLGTSTPDQLMPPTVAVVADRLGVDRAASFQLQSGCSGAVQALDVARRMLAAGGHRNALVLGGELVARFYDLDVDMRALSPPELVNYVLFGDGAGAAVLTTDEVPGAVALRDTFVRLVGAGRAPGAALRWRAPADRPDPEQRASEEDYKAIEEHVPVMAADVTRELLERAGWKPADVHHLLPPQLSGRMTAEIVKHLDLPDANEISCVDEIGNNGNALAFFQIERALEAIGPGERAIGIAIESSKWIESGFTLEALA